ncbi:hypothetical protein [Gemmobacter sp. 24YEA27]|uniref:hypothetical protein n=1 Tax=Gemmobacter sp. 24YEA27 TaxID=3040672 RepID=UPI0024B394ED|nr:hypothetical protein [Gemmobacter sp. 24YEA27]
MPVSDQQIRDDLQSRLKARTSVIGHKPDAQDEAAVIGETALRFSKAAFIAADTFIAAREASQ